jgi:hypothetical protein
MLNPGTTDLLIMADDMLSWWRQKGYNVWCREFMYCAPLVVLPGDASLRPQQIRFDPDSYFVHLANLISIRNANGVEGFRPTVGFQLQDADSGYFFSDPNLGTIPAQLQCGSSTEAYLLACPYLWTPGSRAVVTLRTLNTAALGTVIVSLWGLKMFTRPYVKLRFQQIGFPEQ